MAGILIVAHAPLASALRDCVEHVYGGPQAFLQVVDVVKDREPDIVMAEARAILASVMEPDGALILTDIFGATPSNIATRLAQEDNLRGRVRVLAGVSLPMLVRAIGYRAEPMEGLVQKALAGAVQGALQIGPTTMQNQTHSPDRYAADGYHHQQ